MPTDDTVVPFRSPSARTPRAPSEPSPASASPASLREELGAVLRDERRRQALTLTDVAERAAVSVPYLSEVERGRKDVSSEVLTAITVALELEPAEVLERTARRLRAGAQRRVSVRLLLAA